jgi:putative FmdB family regulatory protein
MPLYEYECSACGNRFEQIQRFSDPPVDVCPRCGERSVRKLLSSPAIQFKGSGWYITDYARAKEPKAPGEVKASTDSQQSTESGGSGDSKKSKESKESKESRESKKSKETASPTPSAPASKSSE